MDGERAVGIYRQDFLPPSETFIVDHIDSLSRWVPVPLCERIRLDGFSSAQHPARRIHVSRNRVGVRVERALFTRLGASAGLDAVIRERGVRLLHAHFLTDGTRLVAYATRRGLPLVVTAHGYDATIYDREWSKSRAGRLFLRRRAGLFDRAAAILCVSDFIRAELLARGAPAEKLLVRPLGVDVRRFKPISPAGSRGGVLFAGRLVEKKGARRLIDAWKTLPPALRAQGLTIIGEGPDASALRAMAGGDHDVRFLGFKPRAAVLEAMRSHRIFAFPSMRATSGDAEGMGIVAMEAQALGTPVIGFDEGPLREVLCPGESGLLVSPGDVAGFGAALKRLLENDGLADRLGACAPQVVAERFDLRRNMRAIEDVYDEIVAANRA